ncbi:MAG: hypothetical protein V1904_11230, partial [Bacteroidota bacterium]
GNNGLIPLDDNGTDVFNSFTEGYWKLTPANSLVSSDYDINVTGNGMTSFDIVSSTRLLTRANSSVDWTADGSHENAVGETVFRNNVTTLGAEYALGDITDCDLPVTTVIAGLNSVCRNQTGVNYSVTNTPGNTYNWTITGGSQTSGTHTNSINVTWGPTAIIGSVTVIENKSGCGSGEAVDLDVFINPVPTSVIAGSSIVAENAADVEYSVTEVTGYSYDWTVTGGVIDSGDGTSVIFVDWGTAGTGSVSVIATHAGCGASADEVEMEVSINALIVSAGSGNWNNPLTWVGGVVPFSTLNAKIASGHTVTLTQDEAVNNFTIEAGAILINNIYTLDVYGDYTNNGTQTMADNNWRLRLYGIGTTIAGTGTISPTGFGRLRIYTGNKTISSGTNLSVMDDFYINGDLTVTNNGTISADDVYGANVNSTWVNGVGSTLNVGNTCMTTGILTASADNNTVNYIGTTSVDVKVPTSNFYYNLIIGGSNTKSLVGNIKVLSNLTIISTLDAGSQTIYLSGDWITSGIFVSGTGLVVFNGLSDQVISNSFGETFFNLEINKSSGDVYVENDISVRNTLSLIQGLVYTSQNTLTVGYSSANIGTISRTSGHIVGKLEKWVNTSTTYLLPVGTNDYFRGVQIYFYGISAGTVIIEFDEGSPGNNGLNPLNDNGVMVYNSFNEGYWKISSRNSLSFTKYYVYLFYTGMTSFANVQASHVISRSSESADWIAEGSHSAPTSSRVRRINLISMPNQLALGDTTNCEPPVTSSIQGSNSVCINEANKNYYVTDNPSNTYAWTINGGTKISGGSTNSIIVNWGATGMIGEVKVIETKTGCGSGEAVNLAVPINPLPTSEIFGLNTVSENSTGISYSVTSNDGYTYAWSITGGTQASGGNSAEITVNWESEGSGNVSVIATNTVCGMSASLVNMDVSITGVIASIVSGNWNVAGTWENGVIPNNSVNAKISAGHTVTLQQNQEVRNIIIDNGATLQQGTNY